MNSFDPLFYPFYGKLTSTQQSVYREIFTKIQTAPAEITITRKCGSKDAFAALKALHDDHPELFWVKGSSRVQTINDVVSKLMPEYNSLAKNLSYHQNKFRQAVQSYLQGAAGKSTLEQERYIHDRMVREIDYVHGALDQCAYSALVEHKSVCAGYTRAFQLLMQECGVPCYFCSGNAIGSTDTSWGPHAWNILKLGTDYYNVDVTWNDCYGSKSDKVSYAYYNCPDSAINKNHQRDSEYKFLPKCSGTRYSFEQITGVSADLDRVLQDGVTCRTPVKDRKSFLEVVSREIKLSNSRQFTISLPAQGAATAKNAMTWFKEAIGQVYGNNIGYSIQVQTTDYQNGWYKLTLNFQRK